MIRLGRTIEAKTSIVTPKHGMTIIMEQNDIASDENESGIIDEEAEIERHRPHTPFVYRRRLFSTDNDPIISLVEAHKSQESIDSDEDV